MNTYISDGIEHTEFKAIEPAEFDCLFSEAMFYGKILHRSFYGARFVVGGVYVVGDFRTQVFQKALTDFMPFEGFYNFATWQLACAIDNNQDAHTGVITAILNSHSDEGIIALIKLNMNIQYGKWAEQYYKDAMNESSTGLQAVHWSDILTHFKWAAYEISTYKENK